MVRAGKRATPALTFVCRAALLCSASCACCSACTEKDIAESSQYNTPAKNTNRYDRAGGERLCAQTLRLPLPSDPAVPSPPRAPRSFSARLVGCHCSVALGCCDTSRCCATGCCFVRAWFHCRVRRSLLGASASADAQLLSCLLLFVSLCFSEYRNRDAIMEEKKARTGSYH